MTSSDHLITKRISPHHHYLNGDKLREIRRKEGLNQEQFGERINTSRVAISNYERGLSRCLIDTIRVISEEFNIPFAALIKHEEVQENRKPIEPSGISDPTVLEIKSAIQKANDLELRLCQDTAIAKTVHLTDYWHPEGRRIKGILKQIDNLNKRNERYADYASWDYTDFQLQSVDENSAIVSTTEYWHIPKINAATGEAVITDKPDLLYIPQPCHLIRNNEKWLIFSNTVPIRSK